MIFRIAIAAIALLGLAGCGKDAGAPIDASVIGGPLSIVDPDHGPLSPAQHVLLGAVAEGLVAMDATGQIEPGLAERWIVTDDGLSYIFRLRKAVTVSGKPIDGDHVVQRLRAAIARNSRNALRPALEAIDDIVAITPEVIEVRLKTARPPLLHLLAQPEMAVLLHGEGAGPFRIGAVRQGVTSLSPMPAPDDDPDDPAARGAHVMLRADRAAVAVIRFAHGDADLVLGGDFLTLPLVRAADLRARGLRFDPAEGLFGLQIAGAGAFFADADNRRALAMAVDRQAILDRVGAPGSTAAYAVLPERYRSAADPVTPGWALLSLDQRVAAARATIDAWRGRSGAPPAIHVFIPAGPGGRLLLARLAADWGALGLSVEKAASAEAADVLLVDRVAPAPSAIWYLRTAGCVSAGACEPVVGAALDRATAAPDLAARGQALADADQALSGSARFIIIGRPIRWSLVSRRLGQFRENPRAWHPLNHLLGPAS